MKSFAEVLKKRKFNKQQIKEISGWARGMLEVSVYIDSENSKYIKGYDDCLKNILESCNQFMEE